MLQEVHTLFQNLFHVVLMATSFASEQVGQSPEADSKSELAGFSLNSSWVDSSPPWLVLSSLLCSSVLLQVPTLLFYTSSGASGGFPSPHCVLYTLLTLALAVLAWALLPGQSSGHHWGSNPTLCTGDPWGTQWVNALLGGADEGNIWHGKDGNFCDLGYS